MVDVIIIKVNLFNARPEEERKQHLSSLFRSSLTKSKYLKA